MIYIEKKIYQRAIEQFMVKKSELIVVGLMAGVFTLYTVFYVLRGAADGAENLGSFFGSGFFSMLSSLADTIAGVNIITMVLWSVVGSVVYTLFWVAYHAFAGAGEAYRFVFRYLHPQNFSAVQYVGIAILERVGFVVEIFALLFYSSFLLREALPYVFTQSVRVLDGYMLKVLLFVLFVLAFVVLAHLWVVGVRLVHGAYRHEEFLSYGGSNT